MEKPKKVKKPVVDVEEGVDDVDMLAAIGGLTPWSVLKWALLLAIACAMIHYFVTFGDVCYTQYRVVMRYRQVALDEMNQECCRIFYSNKALLDTTIPSTSNDEQVQRCQRILAEEKNKRKITRCESSQDILDHWIPYQVVLEVWKYYFPFADMSFTQFFVNGGITLLANTLGGYVIKKAIF